MSNIAVVCTIDHIIIARLVVDKSEPFEHGYIRSLAKLVPGGEHAYIESELGEDAHIGCFYNSAWVEHIHPCDGPTGKTPPAEGELPQG